MTSLHLPRDYLGMIEEIKISNFANLQNITLKLLEHNKKLSRNLGIVTKAHDQLQCLSCEYLGAILGLLSQNAEIHPFGSCFYYEDLFFRALATLFVMVKHVTTLNKCKLHGSKCVVFKEFYDDVVKIRPIVEAVQESLSAKFRTFQKKDDQSKAEKRERSYIFNGLCKRIENQKKTTGDQYNGRKRTILNGMHKRSKSLPIRTNRMNEDTTDTSDDESDVSETQIFFFLNGIFERSKNLEKHNDSTDNSDDESDADKRSNFLNSMSRRNKNKKKNKYSMDSSGKKTTTTIRKRKNKSDAPNEIKKQKYTKDNSKSLYRSKQIYSSKGIKGAKHLKSGNSSDSSLSDVNYKKSSVKPRQNNVKAKKMVERQMTVRKKLKNNKILESAKIKEADQSPMSVNSAGDCKSVRKFSVRLTNVLNDPAAANYIDIVRLKKSIEEKERKDNEEKIAKETEERKRKYIEEKKRKAAEEKKRKLEEKIKQVFEERIRKITEETIRKENEEKNKNTEEKIRKDTDEDAYEVVDDADESSTNNSDKDIKSKLEDSETDVHKESSDTHDSVNSGDEGNSKPHLPYEMDEEQDGFSLKYSSDEEENDLNFHKAGPSSESSTRPSPESSAEPSAENHQQDSPYIRKGPRTPPLSPEVYRRGPRTPPGKGPDSDAE